MTHCEPITIQIVLFDLHRLKENRNLKYAAKVQPFIQITKSLENNFMAHDYDILLPEP
jgi:hypothetical protein